MPGVRFPPLQTLKEVFNPFDDVRQPSTPLEVVPNRLSAWREKIRLLLNVFSNVATS